jgi:aubergine-like protein
MRSQVLDREISQLKAVISQYYNKAAKKPYMTLIIVNKRITQRFFFDNGQNFVNAPSGTIIDKHMVNSSNEQEYDFFMVPQTSTQGTCLPTHYFVACNDSPLKKDTVERLTFALCHYYYNWAGPIKVPAPCMYAHKIAELFNNMGEASHVPRDSKDSFTVKVSPETCESLHFL